MAEQRGNADDNVQENENRSGEDQVGEEEAQANREGEGATAGAAAAQGFVRHYKTKPVEARPEVREYEKMKREQKKKREEERMANPDILFISERSGKEDKLQFYTKEQQKWLKVMLGTIISIKLETNIGTIMSYSSGEFVISGSERERNDFKEWFQENHISLRNLTEEMEKMKIQNRD